MHRQRARCALLGLGTPELLERLFEFVRAKLAVAHALRSLPLPAQIFLPVGQDLADHFILNPAGFGIQVLAASQSIGARRASLPNPAVGVRTMSSDTVSPGAGGTWEGRQSLGRPTAVNQDIRAGHEA